MADFTHFPSPGRRSAADQRETGSTAPARASRRNGDQNGGRHDVFFTFVVLIVINELMFGEGSEEYKRVHQYVVRLWIGRPDDSDTAFMLMRELQAVSDNLLVFFPGNW